MIIQDNQHPVGRPQITNHIRFADGGLPELMRWLDATPLVHSRSNDFADHERSRRRAIEGWREGAAMIARGFPAPTFGAASRKPRWGFDVAGDLPDVGRYLSGHPDAMRRRKNERGRDPVAVLYIGCGMRANVSRTDQLNFGIAVCEMIDALENAGTRVELNQLTRAFCGGYYAVTGWRLKEATDPLDLGPVAFSFMDEDAHRHIQFGMRQRLGNADIGGSGAISPSDFPDAPAGAIVMEGVNTAAGKCPNPAAARAFLRDRLNQAAGHEMITAEMIEHLTA
jgi:hypothetical protein